MVLLLFCSAMISGSEIAFFSLSPSQLEHLYSESSKKNKQIIQLFEKPKRLLATILISNNFVNVAIVILSTFITNSLFSFSEYSIITFVFQVVIVTSLILLFGEIIPKIYATQYPLKFAYLMVKPILILRSFFYPISSLLVNSTNLIDKRIKRKSHNISMSELSKAIDITSDETTPDEEKKMLKGVVKFGDIGVKEIMKARVDVTAIDNITKFDNLIETIISSGYSRIPVFSETFDNIKGILYAKDLLPHLKENKDFQWQSLVRKAFFVPESKMINDLLHEFQEKKIHLAIVVDEYGGVSGIVTLEDIIEEIVGEINDEFDYSKDENINSKLDENNFIFEGKTLLNDFCKITGIDSKTFEEIKGESDTLAGLILEIEGEIPQKSSIIKFQNFIFEIEAVDNRRIQQIKVKILEKNKIRGINEK
ncbi:MAG: gliding motility-associated protein GldE [Bacteroidales bacterium]|nr:gliding motility-associated protein GldE [Bacteroidales bacterium]